MGLCHRGGNRRPPPAATPAAATPAAATPAAATPAAASMEVVAAPSTEHPPYAVADYWEKRYVERPTQDTFEWYAGLAVVEAPLLAALPDHQMRILHVGSGNSKLPEEMWAVGFRNQLCNDISPTCVSRMAKRTATCDGMAWAVEDALSMPQHADGSFDAVVDEGTYDALSCDQKSQGLVSECAACSGRAACTCASPRSSRRSSHLRRRGGLRANGPLQYECEGAAPAWVGAGARKLLGACGREESRLVLAWVMCGTRAGVRLTRLPIVVRSPLVVEETRPVAAPLGSAHATGDGDISINGRRRRHGQRAGRVGPRAIHRTRDNSSLTHDSPSFRLLFRDFRVRARRARAGGRGAVYEVRSHLCAIFPMKVVTPGHGTDDHRAQSDTRFSRHHDSKKDCLCAGCFGTAPRMRVRDRRHLSRHVRRKVASSQAMHHSHTHSRALVSCPSGSDAGPHPSPRRASSSSYRHI